MAFSLGQHVGTLHEIMTHPLNAGRPLHAVGKYLRWNVGRRILGTDAVVPLAGDAVIILSARQNYATLTFANGLWDFEDMMFLMHLLRPGDLFLDIGANVGGYTILASAVAGARTIAFEPIPSTHAELLRNIRINEIGPLVQAHRIALAETEGTISMTADRGGCNHVVAERWEGATIDVPIRRLDDVLAGEPCRLMKMDAEGYETNILRSAERTLANPALAGLIVEFNGTGERYGHTDESVHRMIVAHGFAPHRYDAYGRTLTPMATFSTGSMNTIYVRDAASLAGVLAAAPKIRVGGREI